MWRHRQAPPTPPYRTGHGRCQRPLLGPPPSTLVWVTPGRGRPPLAGRGGQAGQTEHGRRNCCLYQSRSVSPRGRCKRWACEGVWPSGWGVRGPRRARRVPHPRAHGRRRWTVPPVDCSPHGGSRVSQLRCLPPPRLLFSALFLSPQLSHGHYGDGQPTPGARYFPKTSGRTGPWAPIEGSRARHTRRPRRPPGRHHKAFVHASTVSASAAAALSIGYESSVWSPSASTTPAAVGRPPSTLSSSRSV